MKPPSFLETIALVTIFVVMSMMCGNAYKLIQEHDPGRVLDSIGYFYGVVCVMMYGSFLGIMHSATRNIPKQHGSIRNGIVVISLMLPTIILISSLRLFNTTLHHYTNPHSV